MPNWTGGIITARGRELQAKVEAGETLVITKMKLGSGTPQAYEMDTLTDLKQPLMEFGISSKTVENNICEVTGVVVSSEIETPFYAREWGLFAQDPDEGEILYMYTTDPNPDFIPAKTAALQISATYALNIVVLNVDNIIVNIDPNGLVTTAILKNELKKYLPLSGGDMTGDITANNVYANNNVLVFNNVEEMKASNKVKTGYTLRTLGFYEPNDGGGADYVITNDIGEDEADEASIIALQKGLYAKLLIQDYINVKWFGTKGNGEDDDTNALQLCFNYVKNGCVTIPEGTYKTTEQLIANKGMKLFGYNATIKSYVDSTKCALVYSGSNSKGLVEGLFLQCPNNGKSCFDIKGIGGNLTLRDCQFMFGDYGVLADHTDGSSCNFLRMVNCVFTHNNKKAVQLGNLSSDTFTTSCPISMIDCLIQSCGSNTDIGENTDTVPIAMYRMLDVVIQRLQIDNHQHRYNYRIGEFNSVENLTISNLNVEDFPEDKTKNNYLIEFAGCINVNITNTKTWNIFPSSSRKPVLFNFNGCNGRHHAGIVTDNAGLSNYYSYGLSGNYTNNGNWTSLYMEEDLLKCSAGVLRALAKPEWTNICHCSNKSNATNNQSDNSSFNGTLPANGGSLDGGFFWRQDIHDDKCMAVAVMRCKGKAPDVDTSGRFVFEWYDNGGSLLRRELITTGGTIQDDRGTWYKIHRSDAPEGAIMLRYGFATTSSSTTYQFAGDSCINIYSWDVFLYYSKPIPNMPLVNGHILNIK